LHVSNKSGFKLSAAILRPNYNW